MLGEPVTEPPAALAGHCLQNARSFAAARHSCFKRQARSRQNGLGGIRNTMACGATMPGDDGSRASSDTLLERHDARRDRGGHRMGRQPVLPCDGDYFDAGLLAQYFVGLRAGQSILLDQKPVALVEVRDEAAPIEVVADCVEHCTSVYRFVMVCDGAG